MSKVRRALGLGWVFVCASVASAAPRNGPVAPSPKSFPTAAVRPSSGVLDTWKERLRALFLDIAGPPAPTDPSSDAGPSASNSTDPPPADDTDRRYLPTGG